MDIKTLEYMGKRVDNARELTQGISDTENLIAFVGKNLIKTNKVQVEMQFIHPKSGGYAGRTSFDFVPAPILLDGLKITLENYRDSLQRELDEL